MKDEFIPKQNNLSVGQLINLEDLGNIEHEYELERDNDVVIDVYALEQQSVLTKDNYVLGFETNSEQFKTKSGVGLNDSVNELLHKYEGCQLPATYQPFGLIEVEACKSL